MQKCRWKMEKWGYESDAEQRLLLRQSFERLDITNTMNFNLWKDSTIAKCSIAVQWLQMCLDKNQTF